MFIGHYGPSFALKAVRPAIPLWLLFIAVQLVDIGWALLVLLGVERVRIVPGITASNPLDLYYMPYTHSLAAVALWSTVAIILEISVALANVVRRGLGRARRVLALASGLASAWARPAGVRRHDEGRPGSLELSGNRTSA